MSYNVLEILSLVVVFITVITMVFGVLAYRFYKFKEKRRAQDLGSSDKVKEKDKYLYFEEKELL